MTFEGSTCKKGFPITSLILVIGEKKQWHLISIHSPQN